MVSLPITSTFSHLTMVSLHLPRRPKNFNFPYIMMETMRAFDRSISTSPTNPILAPLLILITSFFRSSEIPHINKEHLPFKCTCQQRWCCSFIEKASKLLSFIHLFDNMSGFLNYSVQNFEVEFVIMSLLSLLADVAELVDAHGSGPCERKFLQVRILSSAPIQ